MSIMVSLPPSSILFFTHVTSHGSFYRFWLVESREMLLLSNVGVQWLAHSLYSRIDAWAINGGGDRGKGEVDGRKKDLLS